MRGVRGFIGEVFWRPLAGVWALLTGLVSILSWTNVGGEHWTNVTKILVVGVILLFALLTRILYVAHCLCMKVDQPLRVRKVLPGKHYFKNNVLVILERRDTISVGDILTLFVREGDAELPVCLILVEAITSESFPQSVVLHSLTDEPLPKYLSDESRLAQLQAKRSIKEEHLKCLMTQ